ncbi:MAG: 5-(carboxyamino)imidazole ribonucleotide synthase, partial [Sphingomicrobium sp.]
MIVAPGSTIGIIGGGQLGRMLSVAAAKLGYTCHVFDPHEHPVAADVAVSFTRAAFDDTAALLRFGEQVDVITYEFENLPPKPLEVLGHKLRPSTRSLEVAQDRATEKRFIEDTGSRVAPWHIVDCLEDAGTAVQNLGLPMVLKTRRMGYDGKGQAWVTSPDDLESAVASLGGQPTVAEARIDFEAEFSIILARSETGECVRFDAPRNEHREGILRRSTLPAGDPIDAQVPAAEQMAFAIAEALGHIGVLTVEFFATADGPIVNEIAPRVHNSGHWTI